MDELAADPSKLAESFVDFEPEEQQLLLREMGMRIATHESGTDLEELGCADCISTSTCEEKHTLVSSQQR